MFSRRIDHRWGLKDNRLYIVCTIPKSVTTSLQQAAESAPQRLSEGQGQGEYMHKGFSTRIYCWAPLYLPDMFAALSYPWPPQSASGIPNFFKVSKISILISRPVFLQQSTNVKCQTALAQQMFPAPSSNSGL